ncbi:hypothetical protein DFJ73DRAFT_837333 [Zopfochytrium polystomum]|nr:hypothetical protein DFJ73DRAFT_837333 [Zopfochytrium polystomum]
MADNGSASGGTETGSAHITATDVAQFLSRGSCQLSLRLAWQRRKAVGGDAFRVSQLTQGVMKRGIEFEDTIRAHLDSKSLIFSAAGLSISNLLLGIVSDARSEFFVIDFAFLPPGTFSSDVPFGRMKPDFIHVQKRSAPVGNIITLTIIDAKSSKKVKLEHQIQVGLYSLAFTDHLKALTTEPLSLEDTVTVQFALNDIGQIWLPQQGAPLQTTGSKSFGHRHSPIDVVRVESFTLPLVYNILRNLLEIQLPSVLRNELESVEWSLEPTCEWCPFLEGCKARATFEGSVELIPGISKGAKRNLRVILAEARNPPQKFTENVDVDWVTFWKGKLAAADQSGAGRVSDIEDLHESLHSAPGLESLFNSVSRKFPDVGLSAESTLRVKRPSNSDNIASLPAASCKYGESPILHANIRKVPVPLIVPNTKFPREHDIGIFIILGWDPSTATSLFGYCVAVIGPGGSLEGFDSAVADNLQPDVSATLITALASKFRSLSKEGLRRRVQVFVETRQQREVLEATILHHALHSSSEDPELDDAAFCAGVILDSTDILLTGMRPRVLSLSTTLGKSKPAKMLKLDLQWYLHVVSGGTTGFQSRSSVKELEAQLEDIVLDDTRNEGSSSGSLSAWNGIPKVVVLVDMVLAAVAVPGPFLGGIDDLHRVFHPASSQKHAPSLDAVYTAWLDQNIELTKEGLQKRCHALRETYDSLGTTVGREGMLATFPKDTPPFRPTFLQISKDPHISKLMFVAQLEMALDLRRCVESRQELGKFAVLKYLNSEANYRQTFAVISGLHLLGTSAVNITDKAIGFLDWILIEAPKFHLMDQFDDTKHHRQAGSSLKFDSDEPLFNAALFANVEKVQDTQAFATVTLQLTSFRGFAFTGKTFHLYRRFVDFNTQKVMHALVELEILRQQREESRLPPPLLLRILRSELSPGKLKHIRASSDLAEERKLFTLYKNAYALRDTPSHERSLHFLPSQHAALKGVLADVISVIFGPPGNGKTHTAALCTLRLIEIAYRSGRNCRVVMTAFTKTAIATFVRTMKQLVEAAASDLFKDAERRGWVKELAMIDLSISPDSQKFESLPPLCVVHGTVWAIHKAMQSNRKHVGFFDVLLIDEGSQMPALYAPIALRVIDSTEITTKRLIVCGDPKQLPPIAKGVYPSPRDQEKPLYGSLLDCIMYEQTEGIFMLKENFRFTKALCQFVQRPYVMDPLARGASEFDAQRGLQPAVRDALKQWLQHGDRQRNTADDHFVEEIVRGSKSLITIEILSSVVPGPLEPLEAHVRAEADLVARLFGILKEALAPVVNAKVFIVTPHRIQRAAVAKRLQVEAEKFCIVDTVERMQGAEADVVIVCMGFTNHTTTLEDEVEFVFNFPRLNVAFSRPRSLCILVSSRNLSSPPMQCLASQTTRDGVVHIHEFIRGSMKFDWDGSKFVTAE